MKKSKKLIVGLVVLAIVVAGGVASMTLPRLFGGAAEAADASAAAPAAANSASSSAAIAAEGKLVPVRSAELGLPAGGRVAELLAQEGATVEAGQVILRTEDARQKAGVAQAEAALSRAEAKLAELKAGSLPQEVAAAQAAVDAAQARLDRLNSQEDIRGAEASLAQAQASLAKLNEGASSDLLNAARTELANAEATRSQAQAAYDRVSGNPDIAARPESLALEQATNGYNAAASRLADLQKGASKADIAGARARVTQAQASLDALKASRPTDIAAGQAELRRAQAQAELVKNGARPELIAAAQADVAAARASLDQARAALAETELRAPFAGVIAAVNIAAGEQAAPGAAVVVLADLANWQVETTDLTELDVVKVAEGSPATIRFDALPDESFQGTVVRIRPVGVNQKGDISYTAVVRPQQTDPRLRWNMTASVEFGQAND
jgi:HlyD family secretion protein